MYINIKKFPLYFAFIFLTKLSKLQKKMIKMIQIIQKSFWVYLEIGILFARHKSYIRSKIFENGNHDRNEKTYDLE